MAAAVAGAAPLAVLHLLQCSSVHRVLQMAVAFAEMHDTPTRMVAKGVLHGIVPWNCARPFLAIRLRRRCASLLCVLPLSADVH